MMMNLFTYLTGKNRRFYKTLICCAKAANLPGSGPGQACSTYVPYTPRSSVLARPASKHPVSGTGQAFEQPALGVSFGTLYADGCQSESPGSPSSIVPSALPLI